MTTLRILVTAFLCGVILASCQSVTAACRPTGLVTDTIGWVIRPPADTVGPITATYDAGCIEVVA